MNHSLIVALDFESQDDAMRIVSALGDDCTSYKIGLQLLVEAGPDFVRALVKAGKMIFLDLKAHEIPNSVAGAVRAAGKLGASMVTVHASGGSAVLRSAVAAAAAYPGLRVLALTVITSLRDQDLPEIGLAPSVKDQVLRLAQLAVACGCHGVVTSTHEAALLSSQLPTGTLIVVAGVQLAGTASNDQARAATPEAAIRAGATHIVIGRAVTSAAAPQVAFQEALRGMAAGGA